MMFESRTPHRVEILTQSGGNPGEVENQNTTWSDSAGCGVVVLDLRSWRQNRTRVNRFNPRADISKASLHASLRI